MPEQYSFNLYTETYSNPVNQPAPVQETDMSLGDYRTHLVTDRSATIIFENRSVQLRNDNPFFSKVKDKLLNGDTDTIGRFVTMADGIREYSGGLFFVNDKTNQIYLKDELDHPVPEVLSKRIMTFADENLEVEPLVLFWKNLISNPSEDSRKCLYEFLERNHVPLTEDGHFIAYKKVRGDYKDIKTGTMDNSPGQLVQMDRDQVNDDREVTCSYGLHCAGFSYMSSYGTGPGSRIVTVKVNPADVVAVPVDYDFAKMRVCQYKVLEDITDKATGELKEHLIREAQREEEQKEIDEIISAPGDDFDEDLQDDMDMVTLNSGSQGTVLGANGTISAVGPNPEVRITGGVAGGLNVPVDMVDHISTHPYVRIARSNGTIIIGPTTSTANTHLGQAFAHGTNIISILPNEVQDTFGHNAVGHQFVVTKYPEGFTKVRLA